MIHKSVTLPRNTSGGCRAHKRPNRSQTSENYTHKRSMIMITNVRNLEISHVDSRCEVHVHNLVYACFLLRDGSQTRIFLLKITPL